MKARNFESLSPSVDVKALREDLQMLPLELIRRESYPDQELQLVSRFEGDQFLDICWRYKWTTQDRCLEASVVVPVAVGMAFQGNMYSYWPPTLIVEGMVSRRS